MNEKKRKNSYDEAFKRKAVELVKVGGKKQAQVERELGLYQRTVQFRSLFQNDSYIFLKY